MLDAQTIATVKATIPLLVETGPKLTAHFYDRMFTHNPELKEIFNMSNQRNGDQREALFNAIAAYASNIENLPALLPAVEKSRRSTPASRSNRNSTTSSVNTCWQRWTKCSARGRKCWTRGVKPMVYWLMYLSIARRKSITKTPAKPVVGKVLAISALWLKHRAARLSPASNWSRSTVAQWQNTVRGNIRRLAEAGRFPTSGNSSVLFDSQTGWQRLSYCGETRRGWAGIQLVAQSRQCWRCRETGRSGR